MDEDDAKGQSDESRLRWVYKGQGAQCEQCSQWFATSGHLKLHMRAHVGEGMFYQCRICLCSFKARSTLYRHSQKHIVRL